jgi:hypothetical protein
MCDTARIKEESLSRALRSRSKTQPPPAWAIYEALSDPLADQARREWLHLHDGEVPPRVLRAVPRSLVIWASLWPDRPDDEIRLDIEEGRLTWTLMGEAAEQDEERLDQLRYRLDVIINADLRHSFGQ